MNVIDNVLNRFTMYRLAVYVLGALSALGIGFAFFGRLSTSATAMIISLVLLLVSAYIADRGFARFFNIPSNNESWLITGLILFLIVHPATSVMSGVALGVAGGFSSASKYLFARQGKHMFNPAALAAGLLSLTGLQATTWWIGSALFWPFTLILGLAVVRKIRRFPLFLAFTGTAIGLQLIQVLSTGQPVVTNLQHAIFSSPLLFLATIMLTEPATMPPRRGQQMVFGALVAALYVTAWGIGPLVIYPEIALLIGNLYAYLISPKFRLRLELKEVQKISDRVYNYVFLPDRRFQFLPGQYMEWTLAGVPYDSRGNRRSFTIASSPTESEVHLGVKFYEPTSAYKATLAQLRPGDTIYASQLSGNFTLGGNEGKKLALVAGGIGITPFRSMVKYLTDSNVQTDIILLYVVSDPHEFAYLREFKEAARVGVRTIPVVTQPGYIHPGVVSGRISGELLARLIPDFSERLFYVSGPNVMVDATKRHLEDIGVGVSQIKTDHFSGY